MNEQVGAPTAVRFIIGINICVFFSWIFFGRSEVNFMTENFLVSWNGLLDGRVWTLVTSVFSHNLFFHLFINMYVFFSFGSALEPTLGTSRFLKFYLTAGVVASLSHVLTSTFLMDKPEMPALGASGAISGTVVLFALMFPQAKIFILGILPLPAIWGAVLLVGLDLWGLVSQTAGGDLPIGYGAHLGGAFTGLIYYFFVPHRE